MTGLEFKTALAELRMQQVDFAARFGLSRSTVWHWAADESPVPPWVPVVLDLLRDPASTR